MSVTVKDYFDLKHLLRIEIDATHIDINSVSDDGKRVEIKGYCTGAYPSLDGEAGKKEINKIIKKIRLRCLNVWTLDDPDTLDRIRILVEKIE